ncbi:MAG: PD-(D/E)XK nuclease family protein [Anaerolineae bacterium]|nr:PD-(D/E)XK nuclease family protein [Anaerolineae bacterium]
MALPASFQFSQASLQDYTDCPRRFQLRYLERVVWPAVEAEPALENERYARQGVAFHRLVHQHALGVPIARLSQTVVDPDLRRWWRNYLEAGPADLPAARYPEVVLSAPLAGHRLVAKMDLVAVDPGQQAVVVDWKTSRRRTERQQLARRWQTRLYTYLLVCAGHHLNDGRSLLPQQVAMVYWFADFPADPERFVYTVEQYRQDEADLAALIGEIERLGGSDFPLTAQERHCCYCPYRSLCRRGVEAGESARWEQDEGMDDLAFDLEQVAEIAYE